MSKLSVPGADAILAENFAAWVLATGIKAEATAAEAATLRIPFSEHLCRVGGILCGQALLTGADTAMVIALAAASGGFKPCTTVDLTINYMRPITKADALLEAKVMRSAGRWPSARARCARQAPPSPQRSPRAPTRSWAER